MGKGNLQVSSHYCNICRGRVKFERNAVVWGLGDFVMVVITSGLWAIIKLIYVAPWRCAICGSPKGSK